LYQYCNNKLDYCHQTNDYLVSNLNASNKLENNHYEHWSEKFFLAYVYKIRFTNQNMKFFEQMAIKLYYMRILFLNFIINFCFSLVSLIKIWIT
jgi:hypothetical protein